MLSLQDGTREQRPAKTRYDPLRPANTRYDPLRPATTRYNIARYDPLRPATTRHDPPNELALCVRVMRRVLYLGLPYMCGFRSCRLHTLVHT